ncbi:MAG TPA: hypothetical protein PKD78_16265, partial [Saprospiraceae bacterium]|nr:hypothetical protein [Saprospiraceae bacterium]
MNPTSSSEPQQRLRRLRSPRYRKPIFISASILMMLSVWAATMRISTPAEHPVTALAVVPKNMQWGFALDKFSVSETTLRSGDILGSILSKQGLSY